MNLFSVYKSTSYVDTMWPGMFFCNRHFPHAWFQEDSARIASGLRRLDVEEGGVITVILGGGGAPALRLQLEAIEEAAIDYRKFFFGQLRSIDAIVSNEEYVCDGRFTAADMSVGYALQFAILNGLQDELPEGVARYLARLQARDAYRRAVRSEQAATA